MPKRAKSKYDGMLKTTIADALQRIDDVALEEDASSLIENILAELPERDRQARIRNLTRVAIRSNEQMLLLMEQGEEAGEQ